MIRKAHIFATAMLMSALVARSGPATSEEVTHSIGDVVLTASLNLADDKTLADGLVLITHGTLAHSKMKLIATLQELLGAAEISSLAVNLSLGRPQREFMYDCAEAHDHRHTDAMVEIGAWLDWLAEQEAGEITLFGHSRGGNQTAWYASENPPSLVTKVILLAPATYDGARQAEAYEARYNVTLDERLAQARKMSGDGEGDGFMSGVDFLYCPDTEVTADTFLSYYQPEPKFHTPALLADIRLPTLVIAGDEDTVVLGLIDAMRQFKDGDKSDHVRFLVVDGADHFFEDLYAEDAAELIVEFINE